MRVDERIRRDHRGGRADFTTHSYHAQEKAFTLRVDLLDHPDLQNLAQRFCRPLQVAAGLADATAEPLFNFHSLRHFTASMWIAIGFSPKRLHQMLGHSSMRVTFDRYGHWLGSLDEDHERLAEEEIELVA